MKKDSGSIESKEPLAEKMRGLNPKVQEPEAVIPATVNTTQEAETENERSAAATDVNDTERS